MAENILSMDDFIGDGEKLKEILADIDKIDKEVLETAKRLKGGINIVGSDETEKLEKYRKKIKELEREAVKLNKARQTALKTNKKVSEMTKAELIEREKQKQILAEQRREIKAIVRLNRAEANSIEEKRAKLSLVTMAWAKLTEEERNNTARGKRLVESKRALTTELKELEGATNDHRRSVGNYSEAIGEVIKELRKQGAETRESITALRQQQSELKKGSAEWLQYEKRIKSAESQLNKINEELGETGKGNFSNITDKLKDTFGGAGGNPIVRGLGGIVGAINPVTLGIGAMVLGGVKLTNVIGGVERQFTELRGEIQKTVGATGSELDNLAVNTVALATTFGDEQKELILAQNTLIKEFGLSAGESFDILEKGYQSGANAQGDLLENIKEYSTQIKSAGGDAGDLITILDKSGKQGIFSDKGIDVVKEFGLRIREQTKATTDALANAFGKQFSNKIFKGINDGSLSTIDALKMVSKEMNNTEIPANKLQTVIADVFGGAGEDAGLNYLKTLKDIGEETGNLIDLTNPLVRGQREQLKLQKELASAQNEIAKEFAGSSIAMDNFSTKMKIFSFNTLAGFSRGFKRTGEAVGQMFDGLVSGSEELANAGAKNLLSQIPIIQALAGEYLELTEAEQKAVSVQRVSNELTEVATDLVTDEITEINNKISALDDANLSEEQRNELLQKLLDKYPQYREFLVDEKGNLKDLEEARANLNKQIVANAVNRAKDALIAQKTQQLIEKEIALIEIRRKAQEEGIGTTAAEIFTLGFYESESNKAQAFEKQTKGLLADLENVNETAKDVEKTLLKVFSSQNLDAQTEAYQGSLDKQKQKLLDLQKQLKEVNLKLKDSSINKALKEQLEVDKKGIEEQIKAIEKTGDAVLKAYIKFLGLGGEEEANKKVKGSFVNGIGAKTKQRKAKELDLIEAIRKKQNELLDESFKKSVEQISLRTDKEIKGFDRLREETQKYRKEGLIDSDEFDRRMGEINTISKLAEETRQRDIQRIKEKFVKKDLEETLNNFDKESDLILQKLEFRLREQGEKEVTIQKELQAEKLQLIDDEIKFKEKKEIERLQRISELENKSNLSSEEKGELDALRGVTNLEKEILALKIERLKVTRTQANEEKKAIADLNSVVLEGEIDQANNEIEDQKKLISKKGEEVTKLELEELKNRYKKRYELQKKALIDEYDLQLSFLEEGSIEYEKKEVEKNNALRKLNRAFADDIESINNDILNMQGDGLKKLISETEKVFSSLLDRIAKLQEKNVQKAEENVNKQADLVNKQRERQEKGLANTLAFEIKAKAERDKELLEQQKRLEAIEKVRALYTGYTANASNPNVKNPLLKTVADFSILDNLANVLVNGFSEGGWTGSGGVYEAKGVVHAGESVLPQWLVNKWGLQGLSAKEVEAKLESGLFRAKDVTPDNYEVLQNKNLVQNNYYSDFSPLNKRLDQLIKLHENSEQLTGVELVNDVVQVVTKQRKKGVVRTVKHQLKKGSI